MKATAVQRIPTPNRRAALLALLMSSVASAAMGQRRGPPEIIIPLTDVVEEQDDSARKLNALIVAGRSPAADADHVLSTGLTGPFVPEFLKLSRVRRDPKANEAVGTKGVRIEFEPGTLLLRVMVCDALQKDCKTVGQKMTRGKFEFSASGIRWRLETQGVKCQDGAKQCHAWIPAWTFGQRVLGRFDGFPHLTLIAQAGSRILFHDVRRKKPWMELSHPAIEAFGALASATLEPKDGMRLVFEHGAWVIDFAAERILVLDASEITVLEGALATPEKMKKTFRLPLQTQKPKQKLLASNDAGLVFEDFALLFVRGPQGELKGAKRHALGPFAAASFRPVPGEATLQSLRFAKRTEKGFDFYDVRASPEKIAGDRVARADRSGEKDFVFYLGGEPYLALPKGVFHVGADKLAPTPFEGAYSGVVALDGDRLFLRDDDGVTCKWMTVTRVPEGGKDAGKLTQGPTAFPCAPSIWFSGSGKQAHGVWLDAGEVHIRAAQ